MEALYRAALAALGGADPRSDTNYTRGEAAADRGRLLLVVREKGKLAAHRARMAAAIEADDEALNAQL